jgi:hypothetical protein
MDRSTLPTAQKALDIHGAKGDVVSAVYVAAFFNGD